MFRYYSTILIYNLEVLYYRFVAVKFWLKTFLFIAVILIFLLTNLLTEAERKLSGFDFIIRISYAYLTSFIFYFLVVHSPKQEKKQALFIIINNRTLNILKTIRAYYRYILIVNRIKAEDKIINEDEFVSFGHNVDPLRPLTISIGINSLKFNDHYECFAYISKIIHEDYNEIMHFYDLLSPSYIYAVNRVHAGFQIPLLDGTRFEGKALSAPAQAIYINLQFANNAWELLSEFKNHQENRIREKLMMLKRKRRSK